MHAGGRRCLGEEEEEEEEVKEEEKKRRNIRKATRVQEERGDSVAQRK